jgi:hypothetical protein
VRIEGRRADSDDSGARKKKKKDLRQAISSPAKLSCIELQAKTQNQQRTDKEEEIVRKDPGKKRGANTKKKIVQRCESSRYRCRGFKPKWFLECFVGWSLGGAGLEPWDSALQL